LTKVGSVLADIQSGFASGAHNSDGSGLPHFRPMNVTTSGRIDRAVVKSIDPALADRPERRLRRGDVVFNNTNSLELVGKTAFFDGNDSPAFSNHMTRLRTDPDQMVPEYLARYLHACWVRGVFTQIANNHVSQASVGRKVLSKLPLPLPPLPEQTCIVERLEEIDTRHIAALSHLVHARAILTNFRQAILAAACSGRLTGDWREEYPDARVVDLDRITGLRKQRKSGQLAESTIDVPNLPDCYVVTTIASIATVLEYGTSRKADTGVDGVPVLRMGNIQDGVLDLANLKYMTIDAEVERLMLHDGDLLFNRTNSPELVGKSAVWRGSDQATFASYLIRVRFHEQTVVPEFANYWIGSAWGRLWARQVKTDGVSQSNINGTKLGAMPIPLPPIDEQREIVRRVERALTASENILSRVNAASNLLGRTGHAAIARAFRGELVGDKE
jgi:type I restriction enzyme S subunit